MADQGHPGAVEQIVESPVSDNDGPGRHGRRRWFRLPDRRWGRVTSLFAVLVLVVVLGGGVGTWLYMRSLEKQVQKVDAFRGLPEAQRPVRVADTALNFLVVGKDAPEPGSTISRTDTIMLVHVPRSRDRAQVISIPRDTWTTIPDSAEGDGRPTKAKINAAYAWGGTPLLVHAIEGFTGVRLDHVVLIDLVGFGKIIDALGGVDVTVDRDFTSTEPPGRVYQPGIHHMNSALALEYARERKQFADGDFSRMRHQQAIVTAVMREAGRKGILTNPARLDDFLQATAGAVQVDQDLPVFDTVWALRQLDPDAVTMLTSPSIGVGMVGNQSVIFPDETASAGLYRAVQNDAMDSWLAKNPE